MLLLHLGNHLPKDKALVLANLLRWVRSLLSDSQPSVKHQSQHLARLALPVQHRTTPVLLVQRQHSPVVLHKLHNNPRQGLDSLQLSVQPQANLAHSQQRQAVKLSNRQVPLELLQTTLLSSSSRPIHLVEPLNLLSVNPPNPPRSKTLSVQEQATHQSLLSDSQHSSRPAYSANPPKALQQPAPSASLKPSHQPSSNSNNSPQLPNPTTKPAPAPASAPRPPAPTPQPT